MSARNAGAIDSLTAIGIFAATFITFLPTLHGGFVWDDTPFIINNPHIRNFGWANLQWMLSTNFGGHYIPLLWLSHAVEYRLFGIHPLGYHLINNTLHAANAVLVYFISSRLIAWADPAGFGSGMRPLRLAAVVSSLLFSLHPLRVESVAWISERRTLLSAFFAFVSILFYLSAVDRRDRSLRSRGLLLSWLSFALSLLAKEMMMTLPLVLLVLDHYPLKRKRSNLELCLEKWPYFMVAFASAVAVLLAERSFHNLTPLESHGIGARFAQAFYGLTYYLSKTLMPTTLTPLVEIPPRLSLWSSPFFASAIAVVLISGLLWRHKRDWPGAFSAWLCYVIILLPVLGFFQNGRQLVADRYSYMPMIGWATLVGAGAARLWPRSGPAFAGACLMIPAALLVLTTRNTISVWRDNIALWSRASEVAPGSAYARYNLAYALDQSERLPEAEAEYRRALELNPAKAEARLNLSMVLLRENKSDEALPLLNDVIKLSPSLASPAYNGLGNLWTERGDISRAKAMFERALEADPSNAAASQNLSRLHHVAPAL